MNATAVIFLTTNNSVAFDSDQTSSYDRADDVEDAVVGEPPPLEPPLHSELMVCSTDLTVCVGDIVTIAYCVKLLFVTILSI